MLVAWVLATILHFRLGRPVIKPAPKVCTHVVGFRFIGVVGQKFELGSTMYIVGKRGYAEVISDGETTYRYDGQTLPLTAWPVNEFGMLEVPLPRLIADAETSDNR